MRPHVHVGRIFFALGMIAFGLLHFAFGGFVTRVVPSWPAWVPARAFWVCLIGAALVVAGCAILFQFKTRLAALVLGAGLLLSFFFLHLPAAVVSPRWSGDWTSAGKALAMCGGALGLAAFSWGSDDARLNQVLVFAGRIFFGAFLTLCGIQHFIWADFVKHMVPAWIPAHAFWACFAGVALIAGGVGIAIPKTARLAGLLTGLMIFIWFVVLHIPRALVDLHDSNETTAVFEALVMSGIALVFAGGATSETNASALRAPVSAS